MALKPKANICPADACVKLIITDIRGLYHAVDNPNGWGYAVGNPNINRDDVTLATFKIKLPNQSNFTTIDVTDEVSGTSTPNQYYLNYEFLVAELEMTDVGQTGKFPDGKYEYEYSVSDGTNTYTTTGYFYSTCLTRCCVDKKLSFYLDAIKCGGCGCKDLKNYMMMKVYLDYGITSAVSQWNFTLADELLAKAQKYCDFKNCNC